MDTTSLIPEQWKQQVIAVLSSGDPTKIFIRQRARLDFQALFPGSFDIDLIDTLEQVLALPELKGRQNLNMKESGVVYEFIFYRKKIPVYAKLNLCPDETIVIIYSAHRPLKGDTL